MKTNHSALLLLILREFAPVRLCNTPVFRGCVEPASKGPMTKDRTTFLFARTNMATSEETSAFAERTWRSRTPRRACRQLFLALIAILGTGTSGHGAGRSPVFTQQPQSVMVPIGGTLRLAGAVSGSEPIGYIWQKDGAFLSYATNAALVMSNAQPADSGFYALVAANSFGLARSDGAQVMVHTNLPCNFPAAWLTKFRSASARAQGLARDAQGNIYVTGFAGMATLKLDPAGQVLWTATYDDPSHNGDRAISLALDSAGNSYVTGFAYSSQGQNDYLTVKFSPAGKQLWTARYNSTTNLSDANVSNDEAYKLAVDTIGNVYVSGNRGTLKYDPNGVALWTNGFGGFMLSLATNGQAVYVGAVDGRGISKLDLNGNTLRSVVIPHLEGLAVDAAGNLCAIARSNFNYSAGTGDTETIKFDPNGNRIWTAIYDGPAHGIDTPTGLAVDANGYVYVTGYSWNTNRLPATASGTQPTDIITLKYDAAGKLVWAARFNGAAGGEDTPYDLALDRDGSVYVCGWSEIDLTKPSRNREAVLIKYASDGSELWVSRYRTSPRRSIGSDLFGKLALADDGSITVAGFSPYLTSEGTYSELLIVGYDQKTPRLTMGDVIAPGVRQGCLVSPRGSRFEIQATTDFKAWQSIGAVTNFNGLTPFFDRDAGSYSVRFYRAYGSITNGTSAPAGARATPTTWKSSSITEHEKQTADQHHTW